MKLLRVFLKGRGYRKITKKPLIMLLFIIWVNLSFGNIWLPSILSDNMVLQQNSTATIWGWTTHSSESITVIGSWNNESVTVKAHQGFWSVKLPTPKAGGPYTLRVQGHEEIVLTNILIGEVWICSGQSNMEWTPEMGLSNAEEEIKNANYPNIRFFTVLKHIASAPQDDTPGDWLVCSPETLKNFSSVGYFFGRRLHKDLSIPIGLINSSWGGSNVEVWMPKKVLAQDEELLNSVEKIKDYPYWPRHPGVAYNAMIHPILKFEIAGAIWYQGESNRPNANAYYKTFPMMINYWRKVWKKELPFYFAQLAPFDYKSSANIEAAVVRDAQLHTMMLVNKTGMAVTNDIGELDNIHPKNKQDVGNRLALWALAKTYGVDNIEFSGPIYKSMEIKKNKIIIYFDHVGNGLIKRGKALNEFTIAGADKKFYKAKAKIVGNTIEVKAPEVKNPVAVRFAFSDTALPNLFNDSGLPASAFRTDNWQIVIDL
jgi:sialate O-acetylesterase